LLRKVALIVIPRDARRHDFVELVG